MQASMQALMFWSAGRTYATIGAFYTAIADAFGVVQLPGAFDTMHQLERDDVSVTIIHDKTEALKAIDLIKQQGEGYLLPRGKDPKLEHFVGDLTFFGREGHGDHPGQLKFDMVFNVTKQLAVAGQGGGMESLQARFVPVANGSGKLSDDSLEPDVSFERAALELVPQRSDNH